MKFKKGLIFICLIICLFSIASVCASDINETIGASAEQSEEVICVDENQVIEQMSDDEEIDDDGTFTALQYKIYNAAEGSTITLEHDYTYDEGFNNEGIRIAKHLTINGNNHIIDGNGQKRIFQCYNGDIVLKNINFQNGRNLNGGAIYSETSLKIINCNFIDNIAPKIGSYTAGGTGGSGGAIFSIANIEIDNCTFERNRVGSGATGGFGGAILSRADAVINNCIFKDNSAGSIYQFTGDGVIYNSGRLTINYCEFINNDPNSEYRTIYNSENGTCKINNCILDGVLFTNKPTITASAITTVYNGGKYLTASLKDSSGNPLSGMTLTVILNGKTYTPTTNDNGQVKVSTNGLAPKTYTAKITFDGNANYDQATKSVKVTVNKATPKLTATAKTFKKSVKTKKYTVTLKTNKNKVMKKVWVSLKVNKKTYKVKTNNKGQATFKITNLKKKGKYTAVVKYAGSKYYNAKTVKPKITVK